MTTNSNNIIINDYIDRINYRMNYITIERNDIVFGDYINNNIISNLINNYIYQDIIIPHNKRIVFTTNPAYIGEVCSICVECVEDLETMALSSCCHVFHKACINKWTEKSHKCPNCRQDMS